MALAFHTPDQIVWLHLTGYIEGLFLYDIIIDIDPCDGSSVYSIMDGQFLFNPAAQRIIMIKEPYYDIPESVLSSLANEIVSKLKNA